MKRVIAIVTMVVLLLGILPVAYMEPVVGEAFLREDFEGEALHEDWQLENIDDSNGNEVIVSDGYLEIIRKDPATQPVLKRSFEAASGGVMLEFAGRKGSGSSRVQDVLTICDTSGRTAAKIRFFGDALQIRTADTTNAYGDLDYTPIATPGADSNIAMKLLIDTNAGTIDVIDAETGELILDNTKFFDAGCENIGMIVLKGTSRFASGASVGSAHIDYINIYEYYNSVAEKDIAKEAWDIPEEPMKDFEVPLEGALGSTYTWESSNEDVISFDGSVAKVKPQMDSDESVTITVTATNGEDTAKREFTVMVREKKWYNYYLVEDMKDSLIKNVRFGADSEFFDDSENGKGMYTKSEMTATLPEEQKGVVYFKMKLKVVETATIAVYAKDAGDATTSFVFGTDGRITVRVDKGKKHRTSYEKNKWLEFMVRMDYINYNCDVWINGELRSNQWLFEYEKASYNLDRIKIETDVQGFYIKDLEVYRDSYYAVTKDYDELAVQNEAVDTFKLPLASRYGSKIKWESSNPEIFEIPEITDLNVLDGFFYPIVKNPAEDEEITLTAELYDGEYSRKKDFKVKVVHEFTDEEDVRYVAESLSIGDETQILGDLFLSEEGDLETTISWKSDNESVVSSKGVVTRHDYTDGFATLTATVSKNGYSHDRVFNITVPKRCQPIVDPNIISDEEFFGVWKDGKWEVEPKLNYNYNKQTAVIGEYVKGGDYEAAKQAMLVYYKDRVNNNIVPNTDIPTARDFDKLSLALDEVWNFSQREPYMNKFRVTNQKQEVSVDITKTFRDKKPSSFLLTSLTKGKCKTLIDSSEGTNPPRMELVINGNKRTAPAVYDTYVRAGGYMNRNFGDEKELVVCDSGAPIDDDTTRVYVTFDISFLQANDTINSARLVFDASTNASTGYQDILVFNSGLQVYDENELVWSKIPHKTYSWNSIPGGYQFDAQPDQDHHWQSWVASPARWYGPMMAEYHYTGNEFYAYYAISQLIKMSACGITLLDTRDVISHLINNPYMTPEAFTALMKISVIRGHEIYYDYQLRIDNLGFVSPDFAVFFPEFAENEDWWRVLNENIRYLLDGGLMISDGSYIESSNHYQMYVVDHMMLTYKAFVDAGKEPPAGLRDAMETLILYIFNMTEPSMQMTEWGDTTNLGGNNTVSKYRTWLEDVPDIEIAEYIKYILENGTDGEKPPFTSYFYPVGHLGVFRSDWNKNAIYSFINNRTGGIHLHPDALSMTVYGYGRRLITDVGLSSYDNDDPVNYWQRRETSAANSIEINDRPQTAPYASDRSTWADAESEMIINGGFDMFSGWNDSNREGTKIWRHSRNVLFVRPEFFIISDLVTPPNDTDVNKYNQTWHTERFAQVSMDSETGLAKTNYSIGANAKVVPLDPEKLEKNLADGYAYGQSAKYISYVQNAKGPVSYDTIIYPYEGGTNAEVTAERITIDVPTTTATAFKLNIDGNISYYYYSHEETPSMRRFGDFETDARMAYIEMGADGNIMSVSIADASVLNFSGKEIFMSKERIGDIKISRGTSTLYLDSQSEKDKTEVAAKYHIPETVETVKLNGNEISFISEGEYITFSKTGIGSDVETDPETGEKFVTSGEIKTSVPYKANHLDYTISVHVQDGTLVYGDDSWDGSVIHPKTEEAGKNDAFGTFILNDSCEKLLYKTPVKITAGGDSKITIEIPDGKGVAISENTFEAAMAALESGEYTYAYMRDGDGYVVYTTDNSKLHIKTEKPKVNIGGGSSGGGGSSSGGGGTSGGGGSSWGGVPSGSGAVGGTNNTGTSTQDKPIFDDLKDHWSRDAVEALHKKGIVAGVGNSKFAPDSSVTRAEFVKMIVNALGLEEVEYQDEFDDVRKGIWYANAISTAVANRLINGVGERQMMPDAMITRQEMSKIIVSAAELLKGELGEADAECLEMFDDKGDISEWATDFVAKAVEMGIVKGMSENEFKPLENATRAQAASMIYRLIESTKGD